MWDTHMHSSFSGDSETPPEKQIERAIELKLEGICFTDHMDLDFPVMPDVPKDTFLLDLDSYEKKIRKLQSQYHGKLEILFGMELGLQPHLAETHKELVKKKNFDFIIGSSHLVNGMDPYYPVFFEGKEEKAAYMEYFESILTNLDAFQDFDVYGHIDYIVRYGPNKNLYYTWESYKEILDAILEKIIDLDKGIEINTGGFHYGLGHPNPTEFVIKRYVEKGGKIITLGADAHKPEHVAYDFNKLPELLRSCGVKEYAVFKKRIPEFYPI